MNKITKLSVPDMLAGSYEGPLREGNRLEQVGKFLGAPRYWDFGIEDDFRCQMNYRDFELVFCSRDGLVALDCFWIELWQASGETPVPKKKRIGIASNGRQVSVYLGAFCPGAKLATVKNELTASGIVFDETGQSDASEITRVISLATGAKLSFFRLADEDVLMEIWFGSLMLP